MYQSLSAHIPNFKKVTFSVELSCVKPMFEIIWPGKMSYSPTLNGWNLVELSHECSEEGDLWVIKNNLFCVAVKSVFTHTSVPRTLWSASGNSCYSTLLLWFVTCWWGFYLIVQQILAEDSPDEVFAQVSNIFEHLPNRKSTSLHDYDVTFITGINYITTL